MTACSERRQLVGWRLGTVFVKDPGGQKPGILECPVHDEPVMAENARV
jgi:hypothetical protein